MTDLCYTTFFYLNLLRINEMYKNKNVSVIGLGKSGKAAIEFLSKNGACGKIFGKRY